MEEELRRRDFTEVAIGDFISGTELLVDLFIQLSQKKIVQIARIGEHVQLERFMKYETKRVTHLLIKSGDYSKYLGQGLVIAGMIIKNKDLPLSQRQSVLNKIAANIFAEIEQMGMTHETFLHSKTVVGSTMVLCSGKTELGELMEQFALHSASNYGHSIAVSTVAIMIGLGLNWKSLTIEKLGLGGFLHDVGKRELPPDLFDKPLATMTPKETSDYESHCIRGLQILRSIQAIPDDVVACALEHHETSQGQGFPRHIKQMYINPLARVVGLADCFCNLTMKSSKGQNPMNPIEALIHIEEVMGQPFWPEAFAILQACILGGKTFDKVG